MIFMWSYSHYDKHRHMSRCGPVDAHAGLTTFTMMMITITIL